MSHKHFIFRRESLFLVILLSLGAQYRLIKFRKSLASMFQNAHIVQLQEKRRSQFHSGHLKIQSLTFPGLFSSFFRPFTATVEGGDVVVDAPEEITCHYFTLYNAPIVNQ